VIFSAKQDILCQQGTTIVGGNVIAGGSLTASNVGTPNGKPSFLAAGVDIERLNIRRELTQLLVTQQDDIIKWLQRYGGSAKSKKIRNMEAEVSETKMNLLKLNLIPGSEMYSRVGELRDTTETTDNEDENETKLTRIDKIFIDLKGTVFAGTKVRIGNCKLTIKKDISKRRLKLNKSLKRIIATPIK